AADETTPVDHLGGQVPCSYVVSKRSGLEVVRAEVEKGLRASIVHPGFMLGPWDWKPSSGRMILEVGRGYKPIAPSGGCSVCDSRDVAAATIAAIGRGRDDGREYILAGENWTYKKLWDEIAARTNKPKPIMPAGPAQRWIAAGAGDLWTRLSGREGDINSAAVAMSSMFHFYDSSRAEEELGYERRPVKQTLDEATRWLVQQHLE
ncbi:MAG: HpnA protein, partial [Planctomycetota bacterium]